MSGCSPRLCAALAKCSEELEGLSLDTPSQPLRPRKPGVPPLGVQASASGCAFFQHRHPDPAPLKDHRGPGCGSTRKSRNAVARVRAPQGPAPRAQAR